MIDALVLQRLQEYFQRQSLVPRSIDAAADAIRHWYPTQTKLLVLDKLALYPRSLALDLTIPTVPSVVITLDIGVPDPGGYWFKHIIPVGNFSWRTTLDGQYHDEKLTITHDQEFVDMYLDEEYPSDMPPPTYPIKAHGSALHVMVDESHPDTIIPASLIDQLIASHDWEACKAAAYSGGLEVITHWFNECPKDYGSWTPATMSLGTAHVRLVFRVDFDYPILVEVALDVLGMSPFGTTKRYLPIGRYWYWTRIDGSVHDDSYVLYPNEPASD